MAIAKIKKISVKKTSLPTKKEDIYDKISREAREAREKSAKAIKDKEIADKKEKIRIRNIITPYLDNLDTQLDEKDAWNFWTFPDRSGFKKYKNKSLADMKKMVSKDVEKYKNRNIVLFKICSYQHDKKGSMFESTGVRLAVGITVFPIDKTGTFVINKSYSCDLSWEDVDFKITKFSFKFLEKIMDVIVKHRLSYPSIIGTPIRYMLIDLKKLKVNLSDVLKPLTGV